MMTSKKAILNSLNKFEKRTFRNLTELIYKDHIPIVAFYIIKGIITLKYSSRKTKDLTSGEFIALEDLENNTPLKFTVIAQKDSEIAILDRTTINEEIKEN